MQLPRGTFREIKKNISLSALIGELEKTEFIGLCTISCKSLSGTLVFKRGACILADFRGHQGNAAWTEIQKISEHEVDASLSTMDEAQIQLSLEFNKLSKVVRPGTAGLKSPSRISSQTPQKKPVPHQPAPSLSFQKTHRLNIVPPKKLSDAGQPDLFTGPPVADKKKTISEEAESQNNFDQDMDTFDSMNLGNMTDKIRSDCKSMIKDLELEHLMENNVKRS